jgi:outer membrane protein TolC
MNALLNRPLAAPLSTPESLPPPPDEALDLGKLLARARDSSPALRAQDAAIAGAADARRLVDKSWYPDVTLGLSAIDQSRRWQGYEAMVSIKVPLNWTLRQAEARATTAELAAAHSRREAMEADLRGRLESAFWSLEEARTLAAILHESHIPQTDLAFQSAVAGYQQNRVEMSVVLEAARHVLENKLEHLAATVSERQYMAEIEKLIGGSL